LAAGLLGAFQPAAQATVCTFDDLPLVSPDRGGVIPAGYCGATWTWPLGNPGEYFSNGFSYTGGLGTIGITPSAHSAPNALWLGGNGGASFTFARPVTLNGFWATAPSVHTASGGACLAAHLQYSLSFSDGTGYTSPVIDVPNGGVFISTPSQPVVGVGIFNSMSACGFGGISIDDITFNASTCTNFTISPTAQQNFPISGGTGTVTVTGDAGCNFTATSGASWATITSAQSTDGKVTETPPNLFIPASDPVTQTPLPVTVNYSVAANTDPGFRNATLVIAGHTLVIQQAGSVQFQAMGTRADLTLGTTNVLAGGSVGFSGSGWPADGGPIAVTFSNPALQTQTFSPSTFSGSLPAGLKFASQTNPPCTLQVTATQGSITQTVTLTGVYLGKLVLVDAVTSMAALAGVSPGDQFCQTAKQTTIHDFFPGLDRSNYSDVVLESAPTSQGGSAFLVLDNLESMMLSGGILLNPGATATFPIPNGRIATLMGDGTTPIAASVFTAPPGAIPNLVNNRATGFYSVNGTLDPRLIGNPIGVPLVLDNAAIFVNGDTALNYGLTGRGSILATGNINITGGVNLQASDVLIFAAGKNITLGSASAPSAGCAQLLKIQAAMGTAAGHPGYDPAADLNGDGKVDVSDLAIAASHLPPGTQCQ
jgi:hypothetical protein